SLFTLFVFSYSVYFFFFFSSRRRHTSSKRDWSSDVCSSDLLFQHHINVTHISEVLHTCQLHDDTNVAKHIMETYDYDCLGVEDGGRVVGYIDKAGLGPGTCYDYVK